MKKELLVNWTTDNFDTAMNMMEEVGVRVIACKHCAEQSGVVDALVSCGIEVFYTGEVLTPWLLEKKPFLSV